MVPRTGHVLDQDRLAERLLQRLGENAREAVRRPAGRERTMA
jgi:hypothetical protein